MYPSRRLARRGWMQAAAALAALMALVAAGCGGNGGVDSGGTGMTATYASGPVSGFGSIVVNGIHFDERMADIRDDDDQPLAAAALQLGAMTRIDAGAVLQVGTRREAVAQAIRVYEQVIGPVGTVDAAHATLSVLGQRVDVTVNTVFDAGLAGSLAGLKAGDLLAVYGELDLAGGRIVATRLEQRANANAYVLRGAVTSYDRAARLLGVGGLVIDLADLPSTMLPASLPAGTVVRVKLAKVQRSGRWVATALGGVATLPSDREHVEVEGRVTAFTTADSFAVDGIPVDARGAVFPSGKAGLAAGARVEVEGRASGGTVIATSVTLESDDSEADNPLELEGTVSALDAAAKTFVVRGVTVNWDAGTSFKSGRESDLANGRKVSVKGPLSADRTRVTARTIEFH